MEGCVAPGDSRTMGPDVSERQVRTTLQEFRDSVHVVSTNRGPLTRWRRVEGERMGRHHVALHGGAIGARWGRDRGVMGARLSMRISAYQVRQDVRQRPSGRLFRVTRGFKPPVSLSAYIDLAPGDKETFFQPYFHQVADVE